MQTPKAKAAASLEVPPRRSPAGTPRTARQLKVPGADSDSVSSPNPSSKTPKDRSPKVPERKSPRSPITEKKRPGKVAELESHIAQLQEELKKAKDQLNASESCKRQAQQEAEDTKKQLVSMSSKVEECQQQLMELTASEDTRVEELTRISHDRDRAWQSELEAIQKQHSMDSTALATAMNEIQRLKNQLQFVTESEATQSKHAESAHDDLQGLRMELSETLSLVERMKSDLSDCRRSEAEALDAVGKAQKQLETSNASAEKLRLDGLKAMEACDRLELELEQSKARVKSLEELVSKLQKLSVEASADSESSMETTQNEETNRLKEEMNSLKVEVCELRADLEASETRYQEEYVQSTLQIRGAYEQVEKMKQESGEREAEMEAELKKAKAYIDELKAILTEKEELRPDIEETHPSELETDLKKLEHDFTEMKASLLEKETQVESLAEQNEMLKMEIKKGEEERSRANEEAAALAETAKAAEREALMKLGYITEEADKSSRRAARVTEQLDASQAANSEMEAELRRLKVQADQWRKAAEAAASMLSTGNNNGKFVERTGSLDSSNNVNYTTIAGAMVGSPFSEDMDDDSMKKKNGNVLKKIGVFWKKGH
ncbi:Interactor of constitutive active ROPs 2, chloroplastic [Linum perenne]